MSKTTTKTFIKKALAASIGVAALSASFHGMAEATSIKEAISNGSAQLSFRLRSEDVDQDDVNKDATATTLKSRLTLTTASYNGFQAQLEVDDTTELGSVDYNDKATNPGDADDAVVADPEGTEVNQAWVSYTYEDNTLKTGRQRIALDNHRFVGTVGFRQNEQTYDATTFTSKAIADTVISLGYISNVNRIFGEDVAIGDHDQSSTFLNISYTGLPIGKLTAYHYDIDNEDVASFSSKTIGLRLAGKQGIFGYAVEYATQSDANDSTANYDADYTLIEGSVTLAGVTLKVGQEVLGADDADGYFTTPFATLHKFQGWTDTFLGATGLGNIDGGIEDTYVSIGTTIAGVKLLAVYHDFEADDSDAALAGAGVLTPGGYNVTDDSYGDEIGFVVAKSFGNYGLNLKYAEYDADGFGTDTEKLWLTATAKF